MKQNITLTLDRNLLISAKQLATAHEYEQARQQALAMLKPGFHLGGASTVNRDDLHDRRAHR